MPSAQAPPRCRRGIRIRTPWLGLLLFALTLLLPLSIQAQGEVPDTIQQSGRILDKDNDDQPLEGTRSITFRLYSEAEGESPVWESQRHVSLTDGHFSVALGEHEPLTSVLRDNPDLFLGIQVGDDDEMEPRFRLSPGPPGPTAISRTLEYGAGSAGTRLYQSEDEIEVICRSTNLTGTALASIEINFDSAILGVARAYPNPQGGNDPTLLGETDTSAGVSFPTSANEDVDHPNHYFVIRGFQPDANRAITLMIVINGSEQSCQISSTTHPFIDPP